MPARFGATGSRIAPYPAPQAATGPIMPAPVVDPGGPAVAPRTSPPFRADHVGSLLRPPQLLKARDDFAAGTIDAAELRAIEDDAIREIVTDAGGRRPPGRDGRRAPPRLVAHGLHLPARRHHEGGRLGAGAVPQRARRHRVHPGRAPRRREARRVEDDLRRRLHVPEGHGDDGRPEADDPLAEHGPLPRRQGVDRRERLSRARLRSGQISPPRTARRCGGSTSSAARISRSTTRASPT